MLLLSTQDPDQYAEFSFTMWYPKDTINPSVQLATLTKLK